MYALRRTVRFAVNAGDAASEASPNGFAGSPGLRGLGRQYEIDVVCRGEPDPRTGYLIDIKVPDGAVRGAAVPILVSACARQPEPDPAALLHELWAAVDRALSGRLSALEWRLTPTFALGLERARGMEDRMPAGSSVGGQAVGPVLMRQRFDFAAAHRLHVAGLSDEENRRAFGKCNNPSGHGHNYQVEACVEVVPAGPGEPPAFTLMTLERLVQASVIDRFDHKHLNKDTREFADGTGLNPSVENIARVCFDLLSAPVREAGARLRHVTVWETDRTCCTYPA